LSENILVNPRSYYNPYTDNVMYYAVLEKTVLETTDIFLTKATWTAGDSILPDPSYTDVAIPTHNSYLLFGGLSSPCIMVLGASALNAEGTMYIYPDIQLEDAPTIYVNYKATMGVSVICALHESLIIGINTAGDKFLVFTVGDITTPIAELDYDQIAVSGDQSIYPPSCIHGFFNYCNKVYNIGLNPNGFIYDGIPLADVVKDLSMTAGLTDIQANTDNLNDEVWSFTLSSKIDARSAITTLRKAYFFDSYEAGGQIHFIQDGDYPITVIPEDDLIGEPEIDRIFENEIAKAVEIEYLRMDSNLESGLARSTRQVIGSDKETGTKMPLGFYLDKAQSIADKSLQIAWRGRYMIEFKLPHAYHNLQPTTKCRITIAGKEYLIKIKSKDYVVNGIITFKAHTYGADIFLDQAYDLDYIPLAPGEQGDDGDIGPPGIEPIIRNTTYAVEAPPFLYTYNYFGPQIFAELPGDIYVSKDDGLTYENVSSFSSPSIICEITTELPNTHRVQWDETTELTVTTTATLQSYSEEEVLGGKNLGIIERADGSVECIRFKNREVIDSTTYKLTGILRGVLGTENSVSGTDIGAKLFIIDASLITDATSNRIQLGLTDQDVDIKYKVVSDGADLEESILDIAAVTDCGIKPFYPNIYKAVYTSTGVTVHWIRRTRLDSIWISGDSAPYWGDTNEWMYQIWGGGVKLSGSFLENLPDSGHHFTVLKSEYPTADTIKIAQYGHYHQTGFNFSEISI